MPRWFRVLALLQVGFGLMVAAGSSFEVVNMLFPSLVPQIQELPLMRLHHENAVVKAWTIGSNAVVVLVGLGLAVAGVGLLRSKPGAGRTTRALSIVMLAVSAGSAVVCVLYLVPPLLAQMQLPGQRQDALVILGSIAGATLFLPVLPGVMLVALSRPSIRARSAS